MKEIIVRAWDDLDRDAGAKVEADHTDIPLQFGGRRVTLDLTEAHRAELEEFLEDYFRVGTAEPAAAGRPARREPGNHSRQHRQPAPGVIKAGRKRNAAMRAFAGTHGFEVKKIEKPDGSYSYYYPKDLKDAFAEWEAQQALAS